MDNGNTGTKAGARPFRMSLPPPRSTTGSKEEDSAKPKEAQAAQESDDIATACGAPIRERRQTEKSWFVRNIPNALTSVTVLCGFILMASTSIPGVSPTVCVFVCWMGLCTDVLDGTAARSLQVKSQFGATYDQLADLTCFGIGPALFFVRQRQLAMPDADVSSGVLTCFAGYAYMGCSTFRIARELIVHEGARPLYFVGIPTNLACTLAVPTSAYFAGSMVMPWLMLVLSGMMVMPYKIPKGLWIFTVTDKEVKSLCDKRSD